METPEEHIERLRASTFSIGRERNPLASMLDQAVKYLSAELYAKDVHFLMELIQNAEDNEYLEGVDPSLEFVLTSRDITNTGAPATLLVFNNEKGFSAENINSICAVGNSTKKGNRKRGYIGEKGIGFKSVFLISAQPYIFSNGYQIRFNENPCPHCELGYIVPEWVHENPSLSDIKQIYGSDCELPNTTLILPLKPDKIKQLSAREHNEDPRLNTVSAIAITKETNFVTRKNIDAESYTLHLSAEEKSDEFAKECSYYLWKQKFPVRQENRIDRRMEVEDWVITLAFPNGERLLRGMKYSPGIYAFLPTEMVSNFPFIIQADFILASSRETIQWDNLWNQGILDCVPFAFINALISLIKTVDDAPVSSLLPMFKFLPVHSSPFEKLNIVRESIKSKLAEEDIVPISSDWYVKCIQGSNIVMGVSEKTYLELLHFLAVNWRSWFYSTGMGNIPLIKYVDVYGSVSLSTINESAQRHDKTLCLSLLCGNQVSSDRKLCHCLCSFPVSLILQSLSIRQGKLLLYVMKMPLVDSYGDVIKARKVVLVPATESKWVQLIGSNPWREDSYIELGEDYLHPGYFAGTSTEGKQLMEFLKASDIPHIAPPNDVIPTASTHLTKQNAFLLLDWIRELKRSGNSIPARFMNCITEGEWLKITMSGSSGYRPPSQSFLLGSVNRSSNWGNILQNGSVLVDIPLIDQDFYGHEINEYREELRTVGVMFEYGEACEFIGNRLMSLADSSTLTKTNEWTIARQISDIPFIDEGYYGEDILLFKQELQLLGVLIDFSGNYQLIADYLKSPSCLSSLTMEAFLLVLDCIRHSSSAGKTSYRTEKYKMLKDKFGLQMS
ncbi:hypothetical protein OIU78_016674 [Salix suchowensis]|nr:hypothetical protein OIU78_016674 [Salix suchowensis]